MPAGASSWDLLDVLAVQSMTLWSSSKALTGSTAETCRQRSVPAAITAASPPGSPMLALPCCPWSPLTRAVCSAGPAAVGAGGEPGRVCGAR